MGLRFIREELADIFRLKVIQSINFVKVPLLKLVKAAAVYLVEVCWSSLAKV